MTPPSGQPAVSLRSLTKVFGGTTVVDGLDLDVAAGEFFSLLGPSGCGKTTILRMIAGFLQPTEGRVLIGGQDMAGRGPDQRPTAMIFQSLALFPLMSVRDNIAFGLEARGMSRPDRRAKADDLLRLIALEGYGDRMPGELSGGMQKRVALARTIASQPAILFFDEPTTGLDPIMGAVIDGLIVDCVKRLGATAITITHDMHSARRIGDQASMIYQGRMVWTGPAATLGETGNAMVDQFARGDREGPIKMELRR